MLTDHTEALQENFDFECIENFPLVTVLKQQEITSKLLKFLLEKHKVRASFKQKAVRNFTPELTLEILKVCSGNKTLLSEVVNLLPHNEVQILDLLGNNGGNEDDICRGLLKTKIFKKSQQVMAKLSKRSRTDFCKEMITQGHTQRALKSMESGEIDPHEVDLSTLEGVFFNNPEILQALLARGVNPNGLETSPGFKCHPLITLVIRIDKTKQDERQTLVHNMKLLVEAGAHLEDLNRYHRGSKTSPLHVATSIAILTSE